MFPHYLIGTKMKKYSCGPRMASRSCVCKTMAIIAAAGFLSFSAGVRAECTYNFSYTERLVDIPKVNIRDDMPIGATIMVVTKDVKASGRSWSCTSHDDTIILKGKSVPSNLGNGIFRSDRVKIGSTWRQAGDILFRGPGKYQAPDQIYEFTFTKQSKIFPINMPIGVSSFLITNEATGKRESLMITRPFQVVVNTCTVSPTSQTVSLRARDRDLDATGSGPQSQFSFRLSNCAGISEVTATMSGTPDAADPTFFANAGTAQGIGIEVRNAESNAIIAPNAKEAARWTTASPNEKIYTFRARVRKTGTVRAGTIRAVTQVLFNYR